jgi:PAS domain S-box-containing protein
MGAGQRRNHIAGPSLTDQRQRQLYRYATLASGLFYLAWWEAVELLLPGSFNPFGSRLVVVIFCLAVFGASFFVRAVADNMSTWFFAGLWAVTLHYFYLFSGNASDVNWVVGTYIVLIAASGVTTSMRQLLAYAAFVLVLSGLLLGARPALLHTIFLSGVVTILFFAWLGLRARLRLVHLHREAAERAQQLFDAVFEGIALHEQGTILDVNEAFARTFGHTPAELRGMSLAALTAPASRSLVQDHLQSGSLETYEALGLRRDGSTVALELSGKRHLLDGRPVYLTAVRDLTERKKAERTRILYEAAQESLRIRDEFMLVISHELKTPITSLRLQTHLALRELGDSAGTPGTELQAIERKIRGYLEQIERQIDRLAILIEDVVDSARIGIGKLETTRRPIDLAEIVRRVVASLAASFQQAGCALHLEIEEPTRIDADPSRMEQVLTNLLTNALKYGAGKPVTVTLQQRDYGVVLAVEDHGMGIARDDQARIFDRFERAVSARHISGLGLGLFICKYIVEKHGGRIEVASEPGKGSRFSVILPPEKQETFHAA